MPDPNETNAHLKAQPGQDPEELTSRRLFLPQTPPPRSAIACRDILLTLGLLEHAHRLANTHLHLAGHEAVLHVGCGSGALTIELKRRWPQVEIEGIDSDDDALLVASELATEAGAQILFSKGYPQDLPATAERFDCVICVLVLSRLRGSDRGDAFLEFQRVLKPGGTLLAVDYGTPVSGVRGWLVNRLALHDKGIADLLETGLEPLLRLGGFQQVQTLGSGAFGLQAVLAKV